jgi:hypothetical protein
VKFVIRWLEPVASQFVRGDHARLELWIDGDRVSGSVFIVRAFPASWQQCYLSVRGYNEQGEEVELGMIRDLDVWPTLDRQQVEQALAKRRLLRRITRVLAVTLKHGSLDLADRERFLQYVYW